MMLFKKNLRFITVFFCVISQFNFTHAQTKPVFVISSGMEPNKWADIVTIKTKLRDKDGKDSNVIKEISYDHYQKNERNYLAANQVIDFKRKLLPGTIIHIECYISSQASGQAFTPPIYFDFNIPIRQIDVSNSKPRLKDYESKFLATFIATNTDSSFDRIPSEKEMVILWNWLMNNLYFVKDAATKKSSKIMVDFQFLKSEVFYKGAAIFMRYLTEGSRYADLFNPRTGEANFRNFFNSILQPSITNNHYYDNSGLGDRLFSFFTYEAHVNSVSKFSQMATRELSTWSLDDWLNAGLDFSAKYKKQDKKLIVKFVRYGRYKVLFSNTSPGRTVHYQSNLLEFLRGPGHKRTISKNDLSNIFPPVIKKIKFKK